MWITVYLDHPVSAHPCRGFIIDSGSPLSQKLEAIYLRPSPTAMRAPSPHVSGLKRLAPPTPWPTWGTYPSEGCYPLHGWADTNFPRVSNTTFRHPFDTLETGMIGPGVQRDCLCKHSLTDGGRGEVFQGNANLEQKHDKGRWDTCQT